MTEFSSGLQNIISGQGLPIAVAGMTIVFGALTGIAGFIVVLPRLLRALAAVLPEPVPQVPRPAGEDELGLAAAAAAAYHQARGVG